MILARLLKRTLVLAPFVAHRFYWWTPFTLNIREHIKPKTLRQFGDTFDPSRVSEVQFPFPCLAQFLMCKFVHVISLDDFLSKTGGSIEVYFSVNEFFSLNKALVWTRQQPSDFVERLQQYVEATGLGFPSRSTTIKEGFDYTNAEGGKVYLQEVRFLNSTSTASIQNSAKCHKLLFGHDWR